jgi:hypothetical protein
MMRAMRHEKILQNAFLNKALISVLKLLKIWIFQRNV